MKKADLEKTKGRKIAGEMQRAGAPGRFGQPAGAPPGRREQRERDRALGLVPFAVKLDRGLVQEIQTRAQSRKCPLGELVAELLRKGLASRADAGAHGQG